MTQSNDVSQELTLKIEELMMTTGVPGVAVGIFDGHERHTVTAGITSQANPLPITTNTLFQIGSITKTMTATVAMRLVEAGQLELDAPVRHYLPNFRLHDEQAAAHATVRHLFTHTGGWVGDYFENTGSGDDALARYVEKMALLPQQAPLGQLWSYNNAAFSLAGYVIEQVTGQPYETVMQQELFDPLGMAMSFFFPGDVMVHRFVVGHTVVESEAGERATTIATPWPLARSANPAGAVISTVEDMLDYAQFHLTGGMTKQGQQWLSRDTIAAMQSPLAEAGSMATHVGISWLLNEVAGVRTVSHGGATNGQIAQLLLVPEHNFAFVILTNANRGREITRDLSDWILEHFLSLPRTTPPLLRTPAEVLTTYTGYYHAQLTDIDVNTDGSQLLLQVIPKGGFPDKNSPAGPQPPIAPASFVAPDRLVVTSGPAKGAQAEILRHPNGSIGWLRFGGRIHARSE